MLQAALGERPNVEIYGTDYDTPDGTCIRDYIHILDLAQAHILALGKAASGCYNLGTGGGSSVREVIEAFRKISGRKIETIEKPRRPGDPPRLIASSKKIKKELGWSFDDYPLSDQIEGLLFRSSVPAGFCFALLCGNNRVERILPCPCGNAGVATGQVCFRDMEVKDRLAEGLVLCLNELRCFVFVLCAEACPFSGELINAIKLSSTNIPADEAESQFHMVAHSSRSYLLLTPTR